MIEVYRICLNTNITPMQQIHHYLFSHPNKNIIINEELITDSERMGFIVTVSTFN